MKVKKCLQFRCHINLYNVIKHCKFKTVGYSKRQYLIVYLEDTYALGFLETEKKEHFDRLLGNYMAHVMRKIKGRGYGNLRFRVNHDYIQRLKINHRRYFVLNSKKYDSLYSEHQIDFSTDDQVLENHRSQIHGSDEDLEVLREARKRRVQKDDQVMRRFLPLRVTSGLTREEAGGGKAPANPQSADRGVLGRQAAP